MDRLISLVKPTFLLFETVNRLFEFKLTVDIEERCVVMVTICLLVIGFSLGGVKLPNILNSALIQG